MSDLTRHEEFPATTLRFLDREEAYQWCVASGYKKILRKNLYRTPPQPLEPCDTAVSKRKAVYFRIPPDAGQRVWWAVMFTRLLMSDSPCLAWVTGWSVWKSQEHWPLVARYRQALGETRWLIDAPAALGEPSDVDDMASLMVLGATYLWDIHLLRQKSYAHVAFDNNEAGVFEFEDAEMKAACVEQLRGAKLLIEE